MSSNLFLDGFWLLLKFEREKEREGSSKRAENVTCYMEKLKQINLQISIRFTNFIR